MDRRELTTLLESLRDGRVEIEDVLHRLSYGPVAEIGFAHVDLARSLRCGFPEVIFCQGKTPEWVEGVMRRIIEAGQDCLATRVSPELAEYLRPKFPSAEYHAIARTVWHARRDRPAPVGRLLIITAGTSDLPVAEEARVTATALGCGVELVADVGVAGLHRLLRHTEKFSQADAIVVIAGMEGALPSVVGGLVSCPVIAVPTSVGYGANLRGITTLLAMLTSCASNVAVVNIDSGFNGGYVGALIARRAGAAREATSDRKPKAKTAKRPRA
jgi:NCAIR mutase (PurE)-related protein